MQHAVFLNIQNATNGMYCSCKRASPLQIVNARSQHSRVLRAGRCVAWVAGASVLPLTLQSFASWLLCGPLNSPGWWRSHFISIYAFIFPLNSSNSSKLFLRVDFESISLTASKYQWVSVIPPTYIGIFMNTCVESSIQILLNKVLKFQTKVKGKYLKLFC